MPIHPSRIHQSTRSQRSTTPAAKTRAAKKKWTKKLEWPRMPSFSPRKASRNLLRQERRGLPGADRSMTVGVFSEIDGGDILPSIYEMLTGFPDSSVFPSHPKLARSRE